MSPFLLKNSYLAQCNSKSIRNANEKKLFNSIPFLILLFAAVGCANRAEKKRMYEIFEQSKKSA